MVLVTARAFRGTRSEETEYDVVFDEAEAEMLVPPPQYTVIEGSEAVPVPGSARSVAVDGPVVAPPTPPPFVPSTRATTATAISW